VHNGYRYRSDHETPAQGPRVHQPAGKELVQGGPQIPGQRRPHYQLHQTQADGEDRGLGHPPLDMSVQTTLTKRRALYKGEIGMFADNEISANDIANFPLDSEIMHTMSQPKNIMALRFLWGLVHKVQQNTDYWLDRYKAMEFLLHKINYTRVVIDFETKKPKEVPRSLAKAGNEELRLVTDRIADFVCAEVIPGMAKDDLIREIKEMLGERV
jgi:hypothetical protein